MPASKRSGPALPRAPKRARPSVDTSDDDTPTRGLVSKAKSALKQMITPTSNSKTRSKEKNNSDHEDDKDEDETDDGSDGEEEPEPVTPAASKGKGKGKAANPRKKKKVKPSDAFNRGFFHALRSATNKYYNQESNLIHLRCAEHHLRKATAEACNEHIENRKELLMALRETQYKMTGREYAQYSQARADEAAAALLNVQKELKALETTRARYQLDTERMRHQLQRAEKEAEEMESRAEQQVDMDRFDAIRRNMMDISVVARPTPNLHRSLTTMDMFKVGINAAGNPAIYDNTFLSMLKKQRDTFNIPEEDPEPPTADTSASADALNEEPAPYVAELLGLKGDRVALKFIQAMRNAFEGQTEEIREKWRKLAQNLIDESVETASFTVKKRRERMKKLFDTFVYQQDEKLERSEYWRDDIFEKYWHSFLIALLSCSHGRDGGPVRVNTFHQWCGDLLWLVGRNLVNQAKQRVGTKVITSGLYARFKNATDRLCVQFELNRVPAPRFWIGALELLMIYQAGIRMSEKYGRASVLQSILCTSIAFHTGARIGSLGWSHKKYLEEEKYMKCGDVRLERMGYGIWDAEISIMNRKGANSASESVRPLNFRLSAVTKTHNLWFDTPTLLLLFLMFRGALQGIKTVKDIFEYEGQYFIIEESMRNEPLFLERSAQGKNLVEGKAASANGLTTSLRALGKHAGFTITTYHAIRRDAANVVSLFLSLSVYETNTQQFALVFGAHIAQLALGHQDGESTLTDHYTKIIFDLPLTEARLGLLDHKLPLAQKACSISCIHSILTWCQMAIHRHKHEGEAVNALLHAGFKFENSATSAGEAGDQPEEDSPDQPPQDTPTSAAPSTKKTSSNPKIVLTEQQKTWVETHGTVQPRTVEIEGYWSELYTLFPPQAIQTHGSKRRDKLGDMKKKYRDDPLCVQNAGRIDEVMELIKQAQDAKNKVVNSLNRQLRAEAASKSNAAEMVNPTVHSTSDVRKAREHLNQLDKVVNIPKPSEQLKRFESIRNMTNIGDGLLSEEFLRRFSSEKTIEELEAIENEEDEEPEDRLADESNEEEAPQEEALQAETPQKDIPEGASKVISSKFKDIDELKVLDVDLIETKKIWMSRIMEPLIIEKWYAQLAAENDGKYPCILCRGLPEELKPMMFIGNKQGQDIFPSRSKLERHEKLVHTAWVDLIHRMLTEDPEIFKCPLEGCSFRTDNVPDVRKHCLEDCEEREYYQGMKEKHDLVQEEKRQDKARFSREKLKAEKEILELQGPGIMLSDNIIEGLEKISTISPEEVLSMASECADDIPQSEIRADLRGLGALAERARASIDEDGVVKDPNASSPMERISSLIVTPDVMAEINARMAKKK
ncbi:Chromosome partition protein MukB [Rhizoctonia solani]|uniref:Chromosome partition protein MukB n=1 Tax=Rhizoctonia solani TaxID=456999 RepID=A0A0K6GC60_9AGAM|nr:Chromosome partition protein MukB [Rhizoctonia solani]